MGSYNLTGIMVPPPIDRIGDVIIPDQPGKERIMEEKRYYCSIDPSHQFDESEDGWCPECEFGTSALKDRGNVPKSTIGRVKEEKGNQDLQNVGFCVLVADGSGSMEERAFEEHPDKKKDLVSNSAAQAIFGLQNMVAAKKAYIAVILFDHDVKLVFIKTVTEIVDEYKTPENLEAFLANEISQMAGATDINRALNFAKEICEDAKKGDLSKYGGPSGFTLADETIPIDDDGGQITVQKMRVMIYTDGGDTENSKVVNPFAGDEADILLGAFFGDGKRSGCKVLKSILSMCPEHGHKQFFLINDPSRIQVLKNLFRMASGASGFCPECLAQNKRQRS